MTQKQTIKTILDSNDWICSTTFQKAYIPEYRSRINELRKDGNNIIARRCVAHKHKGALQEWRLLPEAKQWWLDPRYQKQEVQETNNQEVLF